jgi:hypothetical protein
VAKAKTTAKSKKKRVPLKTLFLSLQEQMAAQLTTNRCIVHQGKKGDASEDCWRDMLRTYLPKRYGVETAFIVDSLDQCSHQIDVVIFDQQYSPFIFKQNGVHYVPAESVYAVIEAKQEINKGMMEYAAEKAASVRKLKRSNAVFATASGPMKKPFLFDIPAGIVALGCTWKPALGKPFEDVIKSVAKIDRQWIDFGCAIEGGAFNVTYDQHKAPTIDKCPAPVSLVTFFWQLVARLQAQGTASAIEVAEYFNALK